MKKTTDNHKKITLLIEISKELESFINNDLTNGARQFMIRARKVLTCHQSHFGSDTDTFLKKNPGNISLSSFSCKCKNQD